MATMRSTMNDDALWLAFQERTLTHGEWTHQAHLRIAWMHLARWSLDEAHVRMRIGIVRLNSAHGLHETPTRGYHETLTRVWLVLVGALRRKDPCGDSREFVERHSLSLTREAPLRHYTHGRLFSLAARAIHVAPDLEPLPEFS